MANGFVQRFLEHGGVSLRSLDSMCHPLPWHRWQQSCIPAPQQDRYLSQCLPMELRDDTCSMPLVNQIPGTVYQDRKVTEHVHVPVIYCVCDVWRLHVLRRPVAPVVPAQKADVRVVGDSVC